jgi:pyruvate kinase
MLFWGVYPLLSQRADTTDTIIHDAVEAAQAAGYVGEGDVVVVTGGTPGSGGGSTNLMKVHLIERVLARGQGLGEHRVIGRVRRATGPISADFAVGHDEIIVTQSTDRTFLPVLARAAGLVSAESSPTAHCRLTALELGLPAVLGVQEGLDALQDGMHIVLDPRRGLVYERPVTL